MDFAINIIKRRMKIATVFIHAGCKHNSKSVLVSAGCVNMQMLAKISPYLFCYFANKVEANCIQTLSSKRCPDTLKQGYSDKSYGSPFVKFLWCHTSNFKWYFTNTNSSHFTLTVQHTVLSAFRCSHQIRTFSTQTRITVQFTDQFIQWIFGPDVMKFPPVLPEILCWWEEDRPNVRVTFANQNII